MNGAKVVLISLTILISLILLVGCNILVFNDERANDKSFTGTYGELEIDLNKTVALPNAIKDKFLPPELAKPLQELIDSIK